MTFALTVSSAGGTIDLRSARHRLRQGHQVLAGVDAEIDTVRLRGRDGAIVRGARSARAGLDLAPVDLLLPVGVHGADEADCAAAVAELRGVLNARRWGGAVLACTAHGQTRYLHVVHVEAADDFPLPRGTSRDRPCLLRLHAPSPLAHGETVTLGPWTLDEGDGGELPADLPWDLAVGTALGRAQAATVAGDEVVWPVVRVVGEATSITATETTGRAWTLTRDLPAGRAVTVRHDPAVNVGGLRVEGPSGADWSDSLADDSDLWELPPGEVTVTVAVTGAGPGTSVTVSWEPRYRGLLP